MDLCCGELRSPSRGRLADLSLLAPSCGGSEADLGDWGLVWRAGRSGKQKKTTKVTDITEQPEKKSAQTTLSTINLAI